MLKYLSAEVVRMTRAGSRIRNLYIRRKTSWIKIGHITMSGKVRLDDNVDLILEEVFE